MRTNLLRIAFGLIACSATALTATDAFSGPVGPVGDHGFASVYGQIPDDQVEFLSTPDRIKSVAVNGAPMAIWEALEHGESVECLDCIASVEPLLYDSNARTREIAAWWLRRRIFGVFGPGEVYQRTVNTLATDGDPQRRAYAAYALGEFLAAPGVTACATALKTDKDARVRTAAASALGRLNDDGAGALAAGFTDPDAGVRVTALRAAGRINTFGGAAGVAALTGDPDAQVRAHAVQLLDAMNAKDSIASVIALAKGDADVDVRIAACHALGTFRDSSASATLNQIASSDSSSLVRDMAQIALKRL